MSILMTISLDVFVVDQLLMVSGFFLTTLCVAPWSPVRAGSVAPVTCGQAADRI